MRSREAEKQRSWENREAEKQRSRDSKSSPWSKWDIPHARIMHDNHHLQSTEDSPPSALEINLRIHAMRAYHTVRTIGVIIETCSFSRKRRERKSCSLAQYMSESSVYYSPANARGRAFRAAPHCCGRASQIKRLRIQMMNTIFALSMVAGV